LHAAGYDRLVGFQILQRDGCSGYDGSLRIRYHSLNGRAIVGVSRSSEENGAGQLLAIM
jgi:hypothetical protein